MRGHSVRRDMLGDMIRAVKAKGIAVRRYTHPRDGPNAGLLLDSWHWHTSLGTVDELRALTNDQVVYVHVNDAPPGIPVEEQYDYVRGFDTLVVSGLGPVGFGATALASASGARTCIPVALALQSFDPEKGRCRRWA